MDLQDMKKAFDAKCEDFKKQLKEFKNNNEAIEALKKAHAKELAAHVQEHNRKYNQLLQEKLDSEDDLKAKAEKEKKILDAEWQVKAKQMIDNAVNKEQIAAEERMKAAKSEMQLQIDSLLSKVSDRDEQIKELKNIIKAIHQQAESEMLTPFDFFRFNKENLDLR